MLPLSRSGKTALEVAIWAAKQAGSLLLSHLPGQREVNYKPGRANVVTDADIAAEKAILDILQGEYPEYNFLSEESPQINTDSPYTWIIDPLDGTNNYLFGVPFFATNIALAYEEDVILGLTYDPIRKELFHAQKGDGAFLNHYPISVSVRPKVKSSFIGCDLGYDSEEGKRILDMMQTLWPGIHGLRIMGSAALGLAYVSCGRFDVYLHAYLYPWDSASGILLINEAGGRITDWAGEPATYKSSQLIASNGIVYSEFTKIIE